MQGSSHTAYGESCLPVCKRYCFSRLVNEMNAKKYHYPVFCLQYTVCKTTSNKSRIFVKGHIIIVSSAEEVVF